MGQINSATQGRQRQESRLQGGGASAAAGGSVNNEATCEVVGGSSAPPSVQTSEHDGPSERRSRRESVRRSLLGKIKLSSSGSSHDMQGSAVRPDDKRRWRVSRRWSKSPAVPLSDPIDNTPTEGLPAHQDSADEASRQELEAHNSYQAQEVGEVVHIIDKSTQEESLPESTVREDANLAGPSSTPTDAILCDDSTCTPPPAEVQDKSMTGLSSTSGKIEVEGRIPDTVELDMHSGTPNGHTVSEPPAILVEGTPVVINESTTNGLDGNAGGNQASPSITGQAGSRPGHEERTPRPFSPGGTLVVVHGVVHTTDTTAAAPDPSGSSSEMISSARPSSQRNSLLPNILRRRNSGTSVRSRGSVAESSAVDAGSSQTHNTNSLREASNNTVLDTPTESAASDSTGSGTSGATASSIPLAPTGETQDLPRRTVMSHSVDILGALLSVATAVTAASLLSGSPQRQSLTQRVAASQPGSPQVPIPNDQTTSPVPALARALATANSIAAAAIAQRERDRETAQNERSRMRNIWGSLRERILHGGNRAFGDQEGTPSQGRGSANPANPESLFSSLSRAFNLDQIGDETQGLGQSTNSPGSGQEGPQVSGDGQRSGDQESAPPGSFERFLIELQTDLRTVLSELESPSNSTRSDSNGGNGSVPEGHTSTMDNMASSGHVDHGGSSTPVVGTSAEPTVRETPVSDVDQDASIATIPEVRDTPDIPVFNEMTPPANDAEVTEDTQTPGLSPGGEQTLPPSPPDVRVSQNTGQHTTINSRGVNWWRLYRFPPMRINQVRQNISPSTASTSVASSSNNGISTANEGVSTSPSENVPTVIPLVASGSSDILPSSIRNESAGAPPSDGNLVVPVIVVGLQSVNGLTRPGRPAEGSQLLADPARLNAEQSTQEIPEQAERNPSADGNEPQRERNWHSRVSRLLNRMGRRNADDSQEQGDGQENTSSRAFFIYVIGGYYPPDHQIVTGSEHLDSFEALLALADLLGQVKPPVATEEDVRSSGLEIIKGSSLQEYESENKVAGNCVERCLICLDDYEPEDDIRLLSCKHAFHKSCVDHWLTKGRNNCPACRSEGVKTNEDRPSQSSTMPS